MNIHHNARLTPLGRERMARAIAEGGRTPQAAARAAGVCPRTALLLTRHGPDCSMGLCLQEEVVALAATPSRSPNAPKGANCCSGLSKLRPPNIGFRRSVSSPQLRLRRIEHVTLRTPRDRPLGRLLAQIAPPIWACAMTGLADAVEKVRWWERHTGRRGTAGRCRGSGWHGVHGEWNELGELAEVLGCSGEVELVTGAVRPA